MLQSNILQQSSFQNLLAEEVTHFNDDVSCLGTTRAAITSAITTLSDYEFDDSIEGREEIDRSLDDSGFGRDDIDGNFDDDNKSQTNCEDDLKLLREKVEKLENENEQLKAQISVYENAGTYLSSFIVSLIMVE